MSNTPTKDLRQDDSTEYPSTAKRIAIITVMYMSIFLVTLDQNVISTAIPRITDEFHSLNDIGWYGSVYLLTTASFQLVMGKIFKFYPAKPLLLGFITIFEIGSAICGSAPSSVVFIVGRAVAGVGAAGMFSGIMVVMFHTIPLKQRPIFQGAFAAIFSVASVVGPLVGGTLTDKVTWRWCFYLNLPVGAVTIITTVLILHLPNQKLDAQATGWVAKLKQLDPLGNLVFFPGIICLLLALQWGGTQYSWKNARIVVLLILCGLLCITFVGIQIWKQENATVPPRIVKQRSIAAALWFGFFNGAGMMMLMYYLPIWFQAIKGASAIKSGIMLLPLVLSSVISAMASGIFVSKVGYYAPGFLFCSMTTAIGGGLLTTLTPESGHAEWIGYQVLIGIGLGCGMQGPMTVAQTVLDRKDIATGSSVVQFAKLLGSAIFLPVAQNVFVSHLISKLSNLPGIDPQAIITAGATDLKSLATGADLELLIADYNAAIVNVFYVMVATSALSMLGSLCVEWKSLKARANEQESKPVDSEKAMEVEKSG
ncbi:MFS general substrate transporter [Microthyrium microscopicum]|uniref:MFS general substrate transporter n=1 Tax=Microthyrium microscopicum TaxID=703497 RepID=A0A6A6TVX5_9PEZI|nr:MFS general substrate transporter [Microthyrium microscopicum]